ncbi:MAG: hypothetical protein K6D91_04480 [Prevotella sp.]|nr:hypothetical protein [Prevotella sp.]
MKRIAFIALLVSCFFGVAQGRGLVLQLTEGVKVFYPLATNESSVTLKMTHDGLQVEAAQYAFTQIEKFYISETDEEVSEIKSFSAQQADIVQRGGVLYVIGSTGPLRIFGLDGKEVTQHGRHLVQTLGGSTAVCIQSLPAGTYILQTGKKKVKFMKR